MKWRLASAIPSHPPEKLLYWPTFQSGITSNELFNDSAGNKKSRVFILKHFHKVKHKQKTARREEKINFFLRSTSKMAKGFISHDNTNQVVVLLEVLGWEEFWCLDMVGNVHWSISNVCMYNKERQPVCDPGFLLPWVSCLKVHSARVICFIIYGQ